MEKNAPATELGEIVCLEADQIRPGPILRPKLDPLVELWARQLFERVGNLIIPTWEQWELGFLRDASPRSEMFVWECVARSFEHFLADHPDCDKPRVASDLLIASMFATSPNEKAETTDKLQILYQKTWNRMNGNVKLVRKEVLGSLEAKESPQRVLWDVSPFQQLLLWDDLWGHVSPKKGKFSCSR